MPASTVTTKPEAARSLRVATTLTIIIVVLTAVAAAGGLFLPGLYRDTTWVVHANQGFDLFTLTIALPALLITLYAIRRGSLRARLVLVGVLGYVAYTYTGGAFAFAFNQFYLIYVAIFSLSLFALVAAVNSVDGAALGQHFDAATPRRAVATFLTVVPTMLALGELAQIIPFFTTGALPEPVKLAGGTTFYVYAMDLGLVVPLSLLAAVWVWRRAAWGNLLAGCMLIKSATMGFALLATNCLAWRLGWTVDDPAMLLTYGVIAFGGLGMSVWFFAHCREHRLSVIHATDKEEI